MEPPARQVVAIGDAGHVARMIVAGLASPALRCVFAFADWRLDPATIAETQHALGVPVIGGTTTGAIACWAPVAGMAATASGFYGDWLRIGIGIAPVRDLAAAAKRVGGSRSALLAFPCVARHREAAIRRTTVELAGAYAAYPTTGFQSAGEQSGMALVNHSLTGLAIGVAEGRS